MSSRLGGCGASTRSSAQVYCPVIYRKRPGALLVTDDCVAFHCDDDNGEKLLELEFTDIRRITANVASSPNALLKLTHLSSATTTFKLESRAALDELKSDLKSRWKASHDMSMRNYDDEDFEESRRDGDDELLGMRKGSAHTPPSLLSKTQSERLKATSKHGGNATPTTKPRRASTSHLERINSGESLPQRNHITIPSLTESTSASTTGQHHPIKHGNGFSVSSQIQLLPHDQILVPQRQQSGHFRLDFSQFVHTRGIHVAVVDPNGEEVEGGPSRMLHLDEFMAGKYHYNKQQNVEEAPLRRQQQQHSGDDSYHISRRTCRVGALTAGCLLCLVVLLSAAVVFLSIILWNEQRNDDNANNVYGDDFYSDYFQNYASRSSPPPASSSLRQP